MPQVNTPEYIQSNRTDSEGHNCYFKYCTLMCIFSNNREQQPNPSTTQNTTSKCLRPRLVDMIKQPAPPCDESPYASFPHTYILVCDPTVSDRKSIHSYVILRNVRFSSETPPLRKISVRYVRNIRSKNVTFAVVLRRYRMKVFMFFTKLVG